MRQRRKAASKGFSIHQVTTEGKRSLILLWTWEPVRTTPQSDRSYGVSDLGYSYNSTPARWELPQGVLTPWHFQLAM